MAHTAQSKNLLPHRKKNLVKREAEIKKKVTYTKTLRQELKLTKIAGNISDT
jgi:hypothetical protein